MECWSADKAYNDRACAYAPAIYILPDIGILNTDWVAHFKFGYDFQTSSHRDCWEKDGEEVAEWARYGRIENVVEEGRDKDRKYVKESVAVNW